MIFIGKEERDKFAKKQVQSKKPLATWSGIIERSSYNSFKQLHKTFPSADYVYHQYTIFNIAGNKYRLISVINYLAQIVRVKKVWTHAEYSMSKNQDVLRRGDL